MKKWMQIEDELKKVLKEKRYEHTLGVRYTAAALAMRHGIDLERAQLAGLLHDCAKCYEDKELLQMAETYQIEISEAEARAPYLLHAKVGAYFAKTVYGVKEEEVLNAIRYHTTGKPEMTKLEQIIFVADYIEPNRKQIPGLDRCRQLAFEDLEAAVYEILCNTLTYLKEKEKPAQIDPMTEAAYAFYRNKTHK